MIEDTQIRCKERIEMITSSAGIVSAFSINVFIKPVLLYLRQPSQLELEQEEKETFNTGFFYTADSLRIQ